MVFPSYQLLRVYHFDTERLVFEPPKDVVLAPIPDSQTVKTSGVDEVIRARGWYAGEHAHGFGLWSGSTLVATAWFWTRQRPGVPSWFATLVDDEAVLVDIVTAPSYRGRGYASVLTNFAANELRKLGYRRLWTWIWHSNTPSIRSFKKAEWVYSHFFIQVQPFWSRHALSFRLNGCSRSRDH